MTALTPERRRQVEDLFEAALDVPSNARPRWLAEQCPDDPALHQEVAALLAGHECKGGILEAGPLRLAEALAPDPERGRRIGPYRLLRELGRGGMGVVYLAERDDGHFRQRVALKLLRAGPDADELRRRFLAERQILASLSHPNIAQLLDGGVTDGQLPYLVMEYVEGTPITSFCDRGRLGVEARLALFRDVCAAVHHAHRNLVLHRDIKPGNVLVTGEGRVKLLDFGIAKLLNPTLTASPAPLTHTAHRPMTPEYASPEQVRGEALTTASDVYALGVVLYELLTGRRPYRLAGGAAHELARAVCEQEPERPSARVLRHEAPRQGRAHSAPSGGAPHEQESGVAAIADARGTSSERLSRRLRGDLDAIVAMAMRKEAGRRYGSADLLSEDVQRHLDGLPVLAHRGSRGYRARKFLARHRIQAVAAVLVVASMVVGSAVAVRQAVRAGRERDRAEQARAQAENVASFLVGLFNVTNMRQPRAGVLTADDLVERGAAQAEALEGSPLTQARMLETIGRVHETMGRYSAAHGALQRSLTLREAHAGADDTEASVTMFYLAEVLRRLGRYADADSMARRALAIRTRVYGERHPAVAELLWQRAGLVVYFGDGAGAEALAREALDIRRATLPPGDSAIGASLQQYGTMLHRQGKSAEAEAAMREGIAVHSRGAGPDSPEAAYLELRLADVIVESRGDTVQAEALTRSGLGKLRAKLGDRHALVGWAMVDLARLLSAKGEHGEAERLTREALEIHRETFGPDHHNFAGTLGVLAGVMTNAGRHVEAERLRREELAIHERALGQTHGVYAGALTYWAEALANLGRYDEAIAAQKRSMELRGEAILGRPLQGISNATLGAIYARKGDYATADSLFADALRVLLRYFPASHFAVRATHTRMADRYLREGRTAEAEQHRTLSRPH